VNVFCDYFCHYSFVFLGSSTTNNLKRKQPNQRPCGPNKCKQLSNLRNGEMLEVTYFHNGPVGANHKIITRHMGKLIRDPNVCPVRVHSWNEINENAKEHMWAVVLVITFLTITP